MDLFTPRPAAAPAVTLLAAAYTPGEELPRYSRYGYQAEDYAGYRGLAVVDCDVEEADHGAADTTGITEGWPYLLQTEDTCSTLSNTGHDFAGRARRRMEAVTPYGIARELWTGELADLGVHADQPRLASPAATDLNPAAAVPPKRGLSLLEKALGDALSGSRAMIHAPRDAAAYLSDWATRAGNTLVTKQDTLLVPDAGYPGTGPDGAAPAAGEAWVYGTGMVTVRRGPIEVLPSEKRAGVDRGTNTYTTVAERLAAATFDGPVVAVRITLT